MILSFLLLLVLSFLVNVVLLRYLKNLGTNKRAVEVRWSRQAKPTIGGVSFFIGLSATVALAAWNSSDELSLGIRFWPLALASLAAFLMGLADDVWHTRPGGKFVVQVACGLLVYFAGVDPLVFGVPLLDAALVVLWTVTLMNSINMLDNMDGISGLTAFGILSMVAFFSPIPVVQNLAWGMAATVLGFLVLNWHPARLFMGDAGSQLLGLVLAVLTLSLWLSYGTETAPMHRLPGGAWSGVIAMVLLCSPSLCDTALVTLNRLRHKRSPFVGGKDHSTHNLHYMGWSEHQIGVLYLLWSVINAALFYWLLFTEAVKEPKMMFLPVGFMLVVYVTFVIISERNLRKGKYSYLQ